MKVENYKMVRLGDVCEIVNGFAFDSKLFNTEKKGTPLIRIRDVIRGFSETYTTETVDSRFLIKSGDLLIGMDGEFNCSLWKSEDSFLNQRVCKIVPNEDLIHKDYVYYGLQGKLKEIEDKTAFVTVKHISSKQIENIILKQPPLETQKHIAAVLDKCTEVIANHKHMIAKYDTLIKSRFIEMFGDPVINEKEWEKVRLDSVADIKIGPFGSLLHQEDYITGGHALVNPSHIIDGRICTDEKLTISDEKYTELTPYHLQKHDVVMGRRGEMGRCAVVDSDGLLCGTGSLIIRTKGELKPDFIQKIISFPSYKKTIEDKAVGQTMPNLNVPIVSSFEIIKPPKEIQDNYYSFVQQIDKSKFAVQKSLDKAETLYKALMQEYFEK